MPNDPRGSYSQNVFMPHIAKLRPLHEGRNPVQPRPAELREFHGRAKTALNYPVHWYSPEERDGIREAFVRIHQEHRLTSYACAILPNHIHILVRRHALRGQVIHDLLKQCASDAVKRCGFLSAEHPVFNAGQGVFFKPTPPQVRGCVRYIVDNFAKHHLPREHYDFVSEYDGWE
ncbi:MAG: hypothetical protein FWE88_04220 [Phycisphaerae bacterium]|nr:hypothetical protein [Phycisphaerae bacterium]